MSGAALGLLVVGERRSLKTYCPTAPVLPVMMRLDDMKHKMSSSLFTAAVASRCLQNARAEHLSFTGHPLNRPIPPAAVQKYKKKINVTFQRPVLVVGVLSEATWVQYQRAPRNGMSLFFQPGIEA